MSDFTTEANGFDVLLGRLRAMPGNAKEGATLALLDIAENGIMPDAKANYVPFRLGALQDSGVVYREGDIVHLEFGSPDAIAGAGGNPPQDYAVEQHENLSYSHPGGGGAKYLELPMIAWNDRILEAARTGVSSSLQITSGFGTEIKVFSEFKEPPPVIRAAQVPRLVKKPKA